MTENAQIFFTSGPHGTDFWKPRRISFGRLDLRRDRGQGSVSQCQATGSASDYTHGACSGLDGNKTGPENCRSRSPRPSWHCPSLSTRRATRGQIIHWGPWGNYILYIQTLGFFILTIVFFFSRLFEKSNILWDCYWVYETLQTIWWTKPNVEHTFKWDTTKPKLYKLCAGFLFEKHVKYIALNFCAKYALVASKLLYCKN